MIEGDSLKEAVTTRDPSVVTKPINDNHDDNDALSVPPGYKEASPSILSSSVRSKYSR